MNTLHLKQKLADWAYEFVPMAVVCFASCAVCYSCMNEPVMVRQQDVPDAQYWALVRLEDCNRVYAKNWRDLSDDDKAVRSQCDEWREHGYPL